MSRRQLPENIPNQVYYPQLGISDPQWGINNKLGIGDILNRATRPENKYPIPKKYSIGDFESLIGDKIPNWVCCLLVV